MVLRRAWAGVAAGSIAALLAGPAAAQTVYKIIGPDGRVTFSDQPPSQPAQPAPAPRPGAKAPPGAPAAVVPYTPGAAAGGGGGGGGGNAALPFELRQAAARYPVTLYTAPGCGPCLSGRALLSGRGVPFAERTVTTNDDIEALKRIAGVASLPLLTVGGQQVKGYSESEWGQYLDAAGYPKTSQLPPRWLPSQARPLVELQAAPAPRAPEPAPAPASPPPPAPGADEDNPAGIKF